MNAPMVMNSDALLAAGVSNASYGYSDSDAMLYALGAGFGLHGASRGEVDYIYEGRALRTVPTMACDLLGYGFLDDSGFDSSNAIVTEQKLELYRPLPASAELRADQRVVAVFDHGRDRGMSIMIESEARMATDGTVLFTLGSTLLTGGGGFGGPTASGPLPHKLPDREADLVCDLDSQPQQAYVFRLQSDRRALYAEPALAREHGFVTAPLHEQCTAGMACHAILQTICDYDFTLVSGVALRFVGNLYPGEVMTTEMWQERNIVSFRCSVRERNAIIIDNGKCTLAV